MVRQGRREQIPYALVAYLIPVAWLAYFINGLMEKLHDSYVEIGIYILVGAFCVAPVLVCFQALLESRKYWSPILERARREIRAKEEEIAAATKTLAATGQSS